MRRILAALCAALLCAPVALAAGEPEKVYVRLQELLGYEPELLLEEVPTAEAAGAGVKWGALTGQYTSRYAEKAEATYYESGALRALTLWNVPCADGEIARLDYSAQNDVWEVGSFENGAVYADYSAAGRLTRYIIRVGNAYVEFDGYGELAPASAGGALASGLPLPELVGDPYACGFDSLAPEISLYARLPELGIDFQAALEAVPEPGELTLRELTVKELEEDVSRVMLEDPQRVYEDVWFQLEDMTGMAVATRFFSDETLEDGWILGDPEVYDFDQRAVLALSVTDGQGNLITAYWSRPGGTPLGEAALTRLSKVLIRFPEADERGFTSAEIDLELGVCTLRAARVDPILGREHVSLPFCEAEYGPSGTLAAYSYWAHDGKAVAYSASGLLGVQVSDGARRAFYPPLAIDGREEPDDPLTLYPPLEVVGGAYPMPAPGPGSLAPDERLFGRLEDSGFDADAVLALVPRDGGIALKGGAVTVEDRGYDEVFLYGRAGADRGRVRIEGVPGDGGPGDGVFTIDCSDIDLTNGSFSITCAGMDGEERWISVEWSLEGEPILVEITLPWPDENGLTSMYLDVQTGEAGLFTENVEAYYDGDGNLMDYNYTASDGSYCFFGGDSELLDITPPDL